MKFLIMIFSITLLLSSNVSATQQIPDLVEYKGRYYGLHKRYEKSDWLYPFFPLTGKFRWLNGKYMSTACWRGYIGYWQIKNNKLYLVKLIEDGNEPAEISLSKVDKT